MRIPLYWARTSRRAEAPDGRLFRLDLWGWSNESPAAARQSADHRAAEAIERIAGGKALGRYPYAERVLREERIRVLGPESEPEAIITRNRYGALVLNTSRVPFIDVDVGERRRARRWLGLFASRPPEPHPTLEQIREACHRHDRASFRIYRTCAGFRVLATDLSLDPASSETRALLEDFGADPAFVKLCRLQESFRARLTPKPWRCGCPVPPVGFPREETATQETFDHWLRQYEARAASYATCKLVETVGSGQQSADARAVVTEHDRITRAESGLPLA